jgi:ADP-heptose:LPS heptosyltransferase
MDTSSQVSSLKKRWKNWYMSIPLYQKYRVIVNQSLKAFFKNFPTFVKFIFAKSNKNSVYIAFRYEGGFGDILRQKAILSEVIKMFPNAVIDIYHDKAWLLLKDVKNIRFVFRDKHSLNITRKFYNISFSQYEDKFNLFVKPNPEGEVYTRIKSNLNKYKTDYPDCFLGLEDNLGLKNREIDYTTDFKLIQSKINSKKINYIKLFKIIAGVDNVEDDRLHLTYKSQSLSKFGISKETKFLTVQCGQGVSGDFGYRGWSVENWENFIEIVRKNLDKDIKVVQIGMTKYNLKNVDINVNRLTTLDELWTVLKKSKLHIDLDGACVHFARALNIKSVVLWWLKDPSFIAYNENINIIPDNGNINSISPEYVSQKVIEYLNFTKKSLR